MSRNYLIETENDNDENTTIEDELAVTIPNGKQIMSNRTMMLDIPRVQEGANKARIFPELISENLL